MKKKVEAANKSEITALIAEGEAYLKDHFKSEYYDKVAASVAAEKEAALAKYNARVAEINALHDGQKDVITADDLLNDDKD